MIFKVMQCYCMEVLYYNGYNYTSDFRKSKWWDDWEPLFRVETLSNAVTYHDKVKIQCNGIAYNRH